jgi:hypothetical protein
MIHIKISNPLLISLLKKVNIKLALAINFSTNVRLPLVQKDGLLFFMAILKKSQYIIFALI